jgi:hypothetical protein
VAENNESRRSDRDARDMSEPDLDAYIARADDAVLDCREGLHRFPRRSASTAPLELINDEWRLVELCTHCGLAQREQIWALTVRRGVVVRAEYVRSSIRYLRDDNGNQGYLAPSGKGRINRRRLRERLMLQSLEGADLEEDRA